MTDPLHPRTTLAERVGPSVVDDVRTVRRQLDQQSGHDIHVLAENARRIADEFRRQQRKESSAR